MRLVRIPYVPCGAIVDALGTQAFSYKRSAGRTLRHDYLNDVTWRSLTRAGVPSMKDPRGLLRDDGKKPDGLTLLQWQSGRCATWDVNAIRLCFVALGSESLMALNNLSKDSNQWKW